MDEINRLLNLKSFASEYTKINNNGVSFQPDVSTESVSMSHMESRMDNYLQSRTREIINEELDKKINDIFSQDLLDIIHAQACEIKRLKELSEDPGSYLDLLNKVRALTLQFAVIESDVQANTNTCNKLNSSPLPITEELHNLRAELDSIKSNVQLLLSENFWTKLNATK